MDLVIPEKSTNGVARKAGVFHNNVKKGKRTFMFYIAFAKNVCDVVIIK
jgi:hypothetical protein